jgi:hypothetical protein
MSGLAVPIHAIAHGEPKSKENAQQPPPLPGHPNIRPVLQSFMLRSRVTALQGLS